MTVTEPTLTSTTPFLNYAKPIKVKLVLLGESAVGKSSLVLRFVHQEYNESGGATIGAAFLSQKCQLEDRVIKFEIWDTAGQERFHSLAPMYYRNSQSAIVVYDITQYSSFERAKQWVNELHKQAGEDIIIALVGNKVDLQENRAVSLEESKEYADQHSLIFYETSAKDAIQVDEVFKSIGRKIPLNSNGTALASDGSSNVNNNGAFATISRGQLDINSGSQQVQRGNSNCAC